VSLALVGRGGVGRADPEPEASDPYHLSEDPAFIRTSAEAEQAERERERRRNDPQEQQERRDSRAAFSDLSADEAVKLAAEEFPGAITSDVWREPKLRPGERIKRYLGDFGIQLETSDGKPAPLIESSVPLLAQTESGKRPVELALEDEGSVQSSENAPTPVSYSEEPEDGAKLERSGVRVRPADVRDSARSREVADRLAVPEALSDTDLYTQPTPAGFESHAILRSAQSPEQVSYELDLPVGAELRSRGDGSAEVVRGEQRLTLINAPTAWDADGELVKAETAVDGHRLTVSVAHRDKDLKYPLLVDPEFREEWNWASGAVGWEDGWYRGTNVNGAFDSAYTDLPHRFGKGLYIWTRQTYINNGSWSEWRWNPPGTTSYVPRADLAVSSNAAAGTCIGRGIWGGSKWDLQQIGDCTPLTNHWRTLCTRSDCNWNVGTPGNYVQQSLYTRTSGQRYDSNKGMSALRHAVVWSWDRDIPTFGSVNRGATPSWTKRWTGTVSGPVRDTGLGMKSVTLKAGSSALSGRSRTHGCTGLRRSPCPAALDTGFAVDSNTQVGLSNLEGKIDLNLAAYDVINRPNTLKWGEVWLDRSGPSLNLSGDLAGRNGQTLPSGEYGLTVNATDGVQGGTPAQARSGVRSVEIRVDGQAVVPAEPQSCAAGSCPLEKTWTLKTHELPPGEHRVEVTATDQLGNTTTSQPLTVTTADGGRLLAPQDGERTARRLGLKAHAESAGMTSVKFQYRRALAGGAMGGWTDIPSHTLTDDRGQPVAANSFDLTAQESPTVNWDVPPTFPLGERDGDLEVRGVFAGGNGGLTVPAKATLDQRGLSADDATEEIGPGSVDLLTGNFSFSASDVSIDSFAAALTLNRTFNSRDPQSRPDGPFGPGWTPSISVDEDISDYEKLSELPDGSGDVELTNGDGTTVMFERGASGYVPEDGFEDFKLTKPDASTFSLGDVDGNATVFKKQANGEFMPQEVRQPGSANKTSYEYEVGPSGKPRVKQVLAPVPAGVASCAPLARGCRALRFEYASSTTASGQTQVDLGDYAGRLRRVTFTAWDPVSSSMKTDGVAEYRYDSAGRLREAWDPRISPAPREAYTYDTEGRLTEISPPGESAWQLAYAARPEDADGGRLRSAGRSTPQGEATSTVVYGVPVSGAGAPYAMGAADTDRWAQSDRPTDATAVFGPDQIPSGDPPVSYSRAALHYLNRDGREVNEVAPGGHTTTAEHDAKGNVVRELSAANRARALAAGGGSPQRSRELDTQSTFSADGLDEIEELGPQHAVELETGETVQARARTLTDYEQHLPTTVRSGAQVVGGSALADERVSKTEYDFTLKQPTGTITDATTGGDNLRKVTLYDSTTGLPTETRMPRNPQGGDASAKKTTYYSAGANSDPDCANRPEWANLPCRTAPAAQPGTPGLPDLPTETTTYNRLNQPTVATERVGSDSRTTTNTYDAAGRKLSEALSSTKGEPLPTATTGYDAASGKPTTVSTTEAGTTRTITTGYDSVGRTTTYTDADGNVSTTSYDLLGRPLTTSDGKGSQTRAYDPASGLLTRLDDSAAGTFTASYDPDGKLVEKTLPNGLKVTTAYDETASPKRLTYQKTNYCSSGCTWFDFEVSESVHGQWRSQRSGLSRQRYDYDRVGRLTRVEDTPAGQGCSTRSYAYDADSNRTRKVTRGPASGGACDTTSAGQSSDSSHDAADRMTDSGVQYDAFGRMTELPASRSGGGILRSSFYANDLTRSQSQDGTTNSYALDPATRQRERTQTRSGQTEVETMHYADDSDSPAWSALRRNGADAGFTRNVEGIDGDLAAIQTSGEETMLQLSNLHGDVVAEAPVDPLLGAPTATYESDEFGNPRQTPAKRMGWLGAKQRRSELDSGVVQMGVRSYVPAMGRFTSVDPVEGGSANDYDYADQDPVNQTDLNGDCLRCIIEVAKRTFNWAVRKFGRQKAKRYVRPGRQPRRARIRGYTRHGLAQAIQRGGHGVHPRYILEAVRHGKRTTRGRGRRKTYRYSSRNAVVVLNRRRHVVTVWPKTVRAWRCRIC
jgi:RHS repeat-associated protein